jgi:hypothetical protein
MLKNQTNYNLECREGVIYICPLQYICPCTMISILDLNLRKTYRLHKSEVENYNNDPDLLLLIKITSYLNLVLSQIYLIFFDNYTVQRIRSQHARTLTSMNTYANPTPMSISEGLSTGIPGYSGSH